jgi:hypothetical protein
MVSKQYVDSNFLTPRLSAIVFAVTRSAEREICGTAAHVPSVVPGGLDFFN